MTLRPFELNPAKGGPLCTIQFEGKTLPARQGEPLIHTLLAHGLVITSRSPKYHRPRGAFCLKGSCGQCFMRIDGRPSRAACTEPARQGRVLKRENGFPSADRDLFRIADTIFPKGFDHHRLGTTPLLWLNDVIQKVARKMAGFGAAPQDAHSTTEPIEHHKVDLLIIGAGLSGLSALGGALKNESKILVIEKQPKPGGVLRTGLLPEHDDLSFKTQQLLDNGQAQLWCSSTALGLYPGKHGPEILVRKRSAGEDRLVRIAAQTLLLATGGYEQRPLFGAHDLPGHFAARAFADLVLQGQILPGRKVVVFDRGNVIGERLHKQLLHLGISSCRVTESGAATIKAARGAKRIRGVDLCSGDGISQFRRCDLIASSMGICPAFELAQQGGCVTEYRPELGAFAVQADAKTGETSVPWIRAVGEMTGTPLSKCHMQAKGVGQALR